MSEQSALNQSQVTFKLNDVKVETPVGKNIDANKLFDNVLNMESRPWTKDNNLPRTIEYVSETKSKGFSAYGMNGLLFTVTKAYSDHYPLTLKPCDIMYVISHGLAIHIKKNAEKLKTHFSDQQDKYKIVVIRNGFVKGSKNNDWFGVFDEFATTVGKTVLDTNLISLMQKKFESTTRKSMAARNISIMDCMQPYCDYELYTKCGIPQITLRGSSEEWDHVRKFANYLRKYDLDWWIDELDKVLEQFVVASGRTTTDNEIDLEFWNRMVKEKNQSGGPYYSGWISVFFPYIGPKDNLKRNDFHTKFTSNSIPSGISNVDVLWKYLGTDIPMKVHTGMMCCTVNKKGSLRPKLLFCVEDCGPVITNVNGFAVGEKDVDGFVITDDAKLATQHGRYYNPASLHYYHKYGRTEGVTVNCDLCKVKDIPVSISNGTDYDLCVKCIDRVTTFIKLREPPKRNGRLGF
jgi:hypothetical protein